MPSSSSSGAACCTRVAGAELRLLAHERRAQARCARRSTSAGAVAGDDDDAASPPRPAAAPRTCCNKWRPPRVCRTFGRAERIRVPCPAAMTTTFNTMPPSALPRARRPVADYRGAVAGAAARADRLQPAQARLRAGEPAGRTAGSTATSTSTTPSRLACAQRARRCHGVASAQRSCPTTSAAGARRGRGRSATRRPSACAPGRGELRGRIDPVLQYLAPTIADVALTLSPAQVAHIEKRFAESQRASAATTTWQRDPQRASARRSKRADRARRDALRQARSRPSASWSPHSVAHLAATTAELASAERQRRQHGGRSRWCADCATAASAPRRGASRQVRALSAARSTIRRARANAATSSASRRTTARCASELHSAASAGAAACRGAEAEAAGATDLRAR